MSLASAALRAAFVKAIEGRTSAGKSVFNAPKEPLSRMKNSPVIAIYSGAYRFTADGRNLYGRFGRDKKLELVVQTYLPPGDVIIEGLDFNMSDGGPGLAMDILWRQIVDAVSDPANPWSDVIGSLVDAYGSVSSAPVLVETERGVQFPCRETSIPCDIIHDPSMGKPLSGAWIDIHKALDADWDTAPVARLIKNVAERPAGMPEWRITQAREGLTEAEIRALGDGPADDGASGEIPTIAQVQLHEGDGE